MMRHIYTILALIFTAILLAQVPQGINYQATIRNNAGNLLVNQNAQLKFSIYQQSPTGQLVYTEQHSTSTDELGAVKLILGHGTVLTGIFNQINWSLGNYYLEISVNTGSGFISLGTTQMMSVPYSLYAEKAGSTNLKTVSLGKPAFNGFSILVDYIILPTGEDFIESGIVFGLSANTNVENNIFNSTYNVFRFTSDALFGSSDGLQPNTTYYIKAYAKKPDNSYIYSDMKSITTPW